MIGLSLLMPFRDHRRRTTCLPSGKLAYGNMSEDEWERRVVLPPWITLLVPSMALSDSAALKRGAGGRGEGGEGGRGGATVSPPLFMVSM